MVKKEVKQQETHPAYLMPKNLGEKASDKLTQLAGSWSFIIIFLAIIVAWIAMNSYFLINYGKDSFDPYPFILLNLGLSLLAALQAPIILMSQNRQMEKDRQRAEYDYAVNRKAEREIQEIKELILKLRRK